MALPRLLLMITMSQSTIHRPMTNGASKQSVALQRLTAPVATRLCVPRSYGLNRFYVCIGYHWRPLVASNTAQGGGGNFKGRKPIGRFIVVNHGWQIEPTDGSNLVGTSGYLSVYLFIYLSISLSLSLSFYLSICLSVYLSIRLSAYLSVCLSVCLSIYLSIYLSLSLSLSLSFCLSICLSICLSVCLSVCLSICLSICLSASLKTKLSWETSLKFGS